MWDSHGVLYYCNLENKGMNKDYLLHIPLNTRTMIANWQYVMVHSEASC